MDHYSTSDTTRVAVIIPVKDASRTIKKCLDSLLSLDYYNYEIIIIDDGSSDTTLKVLDNYKDKEKIKVISTPGIGPSAARNLAAASTSTTAEYIAFTDSDCIVHKSWLKELIQGLRSYPEAIACGGIQRLPQDATYFEKKVFLFMKKSGFITDYMRQVRSDKIIAVNHNPSCNVMYKRDIFLKEGGFRLRFWPGEDVELDYRLKREGYKIIFNPQAMVYHYHSSDLSSFLKWMSRYGWAQGYLIRNYGIFRNIQGFALLSLVTAISFFLAIYFKYLFLYLGLILFVLLGLVVYFNFDFFVFFLFLTGSLYWLFGFLGGLFSGQRYKIAGILKF